MRLSMLPTHCSPIAVDIGTTSVKVMQVAGADRPALVAVAELNVPETIRGDTEKRYAFLAEELPGLLKANEFKGKRVVCAPLASHVLVQTIQLERLVGSVDDNALAAAQLEAEHGCAPGSLVVRSTPIIPTTRGGRAVTETLCWSMSREDAMRHLELFQSMRMKLVGMHSQVFAMNSAFAHLNRRTSDASLCTMYVDLGWGGMKICLSHGQEIVFAKQVRIGGRQFDALVAKSTGCDARTARQRRMEQGVVSVANASPTASASETSTEGLAMLRAGMERARRTGETQETVVATDRRQGITPLELRNTVAPNRTASSATNETVFEVAGVDCSELIESMADELTMCARYHGSLFSGQRIDRVVFLGGEARSTALCKQLAQALNTPAQLGDPIARFASSPDDPALPDPGKAAPEWAVACGLCTAPCDL